MNPELLCFIIQVYTYLKLLIVKVGYMEMKTIIIGPVHILIIIKKRKK